MVMTCKSFYESVVRVGAGEALNRPYRTKGESAMQ